MHVHISIHCRSCFKELDMMSTVHCQKEGNFFDDILAFQLDRISFFILPLLRPSWDQTAFHATAVDVSCTWGQRPCRG